MADTIVSRKIQSLTLGVGVVIGLAIVYFMVKEKKKSSKVIDGGEQKNVQVAKFEVPPR